MSPSEFWRLHPSELWWIVEALEEKNEKAKPGGLTESEYAECLAALRED